MKGKVIKTIKSLVYFEKPYNTQLTESLLECHESCNLIRSLNCL